MRFPFLALSIAATLFASGCYARARVTYRPPVPAEVVVNAPPPPVRDVVVSRPAAPAADAAWVDGHWKREGGEWVWSEGHWERGHAGEAWVPPVAEERGERVVYHPGYWRPEDRPPAPEYRRSGTVRVTARPATPARRPAGPRVRATSPGDGSVTVRERPAPAPNAQNADPSVAVAVRPAPAGTRPGTSEARPPRTVAVGPNGANTTATAPRTVNAPNQGANVATTTPRSVTAPNQGADVATTTPRTVTVPNQGANTRANVPQTRVAPGAVPTPGTGPSREIALTCSINTQRAPLNGLITVSGTFASSARVQIGGTFAPIVNRRTRQLRVRVPGSSGGGLVRVLQGEQVANCGTLSVGR